MAIDPLSSHLIKESVSANSDTNSDLVYFVKLFQENMSSIDSRAKRQELSSSRKKSKEMRRKKYSVS